MYPTFLDRRPAIVGACLLVFVMSCEGASLGIEAPPTTALPKVQHKESTNSSRFILDTANLDLNNDGCISGPEELEGFKQHVIDALAGSPNSVMRAHSIVHRTDVNRDGKICWCDFISIYLHEKFPNGKHSVPFLVLPDTAMFTQLDENHDGQLTGSEMGKLEKEFESCLPHSQAQSIVAAIAGISGQDDSISREEFEVFFNTPKESSSPAGASAQVKGQNP